MKTIVTHDSSFHTDDVFAVATLSLLLGEIKIVRSRDQKIFETADYLVDVGMKHDPSHNFFDHHQPGGAGKRKNGIPYAAFGLVWKEFGERVAGGIEIAEVVEDKLVVPIDAHDNGFDMSTPTVDGVAEYNIGDFLDSFMNSRMTQEELDKTFNDVVQIAKGILEREIAISAQKVKDWNEVREVYKLSENKKVITLPTHMSWKKVLIPTEAEFIISDRPDGKWQARAVPKKESSYDLKRSFPKEWSGLRDEELRLLSGVDDAVFCHKNLFLAIALSKEGAEAFAKKALEA